MGYIPHTLAGPARLGASPLHSTTQLVGFLLFGMVGWEPPPRPPVVAVAICAMPLQSKDSLDSTRRA